MNIFKSAKEWAIPTLVGKIDFPKSFVERYEKEFGDIYMNPYHNKLFIATRIQAILSESFEVDNTDKLNKISLYQQHGFQNKRSIRNFTK